MPRGRAPELVSDPAVDGAGLQVRRGGRPVLHGLDLRIRPASVTGLLGPSGCGKTTLMRSIVGVQRIERGRVTVLGAPAGSPGLRSRVAYMPQAPSVYLDLSIGENLRYFARLRARQPAGGLPGSGCALVRAVRVHRDVPDHVDRDAARAHVRHARAPDDAAAPHEALGASG